MNGYNQPPYPQEGYGSVPLMPDSQQPPAPQQ